MRKVIKFICSIVALLILCFLGLVIFLMITEFKPKDVEEVAISGSNDKKVELDKEYNILSWNIGYGGLDKDTDFFMDGGKMVFPINKDHVENALDGIISSIKEINPDFTFLQEVDSDSKRTFHINEVRKFDESFFGQSTFAYNYKVIFVPFPWPPMGKINSGIYTHSNYEIDHSYRYQQPVPHKFPVRLANLKRGFNASYLPIKNSDKELVLVNVHLDAYESGSSGRVAQSKQIIAFVADEYKKGNYVIVGGDFNQELRKGLVYDNPEGIWTPSPFPYEYLTDDLKVVIDDKQTTSRLNNKPYDPNDSYENIIDGFIVSKNVEIIKCKGYDFGFKNSDHNPVSIKFKLK